MTKRPRVRRGGGSSGPARMDEASSPRAQAASATPVRTLLLGAVVFACACAVFWPSRTYSFLNWDDNVYILKNPWIRELTWANVKGVFTHIYFQNYLPLHLLSYMLDHALWGLKAGGYHVSSVLIHALNSVLCLLVAKRLSGSSTVGFIAALLFAVHPSHVEAVAWVSSRKEVLSTTFLLLSLLSYLGARKGRALRPLPYLASIAWFLLAMLTKVSVVVLPAFLLLLDRMPDAKGARGGKMPLLQAVLTKIPYGIVGAALIVVNSRAQVTARAAYAHELLPYLMVKGHAVWNYLGLLLGMKGSPDYDLPSLEGGAPRAILQIAGLLALPALAFLLYRWKRRMEFLGVVWTFVTLLPALLFPLVTYMADRYLYAPSAGFCWALAAVLAGAGEWRFAPLGRWKAAVAAAVAAAFVLVFTLRTLEYSKVWKDSESLWTYAITRSRDYRVFNNLAQVRMDQKRWEEAERLLKQGATAENVTSFQSLGVLYYGLHRYDEALRATDRAIQIQSEKRTDPALEAELHFNRGAILWIQGAADRAVEEWRTALRLDPGHAQAREWLAVAARK